ncbi:SusE domain-containing protein [Hymenobacter sp. H14-R3]|uniref:SusE domain-containing protein n=1 Tax=Hymenobacter sp. H14-R3 TaxID=3046308 RepID=UPI0024BA9348|nr:SusE domain-containing protein [Hymenobacter sp. H14-R3]MDJ0366954.1 SusE domain-containing protein [Hymenobacter sp. H14-R3]
MSSCKKEDVQATLIPTSTPTLAASTNTVVLTQANAAQPAVTFTWTPITGFNWTNAEHPYNPAVAYTLQFDKKGNNFASAASIDAGSGPNTVLNVADLDAALLAAGIVPGTATALEVRLRSVYAANSPLYTAALPLTATTYAYCAQPAKAWGIVGPAGPGWPGGSIDFVMTYDCDAKTYTYTGLFNGPSATATDANQFKFRFAKHWATSLGGVGPDVPLVSDNGGNLKINATGTYTVTLYNAADTTKAGLAKAYYTIK